MGPDARPNGFSVEVSQCRAEGTRQDPDGEVRGGEVVLRLCVTLSWFEAAGELMQIQSEGMTSLDRLHSTSLSLAKLASIRCAPPSSEWVRCGPNLPTCGGLTSDWVAIDYTQSLRHWQSEILASRPMRQHQRVSYIRHGMKIIDTFAANPVLKRQDKSFKCHYRHASYQV